MIGRWSMCHHSYSMVHPPPFKYKKTPYYIGRMDFGTGKLKVDSTYGMGGFQERPLSYCWNASAAMGIQADMQYSIIYS